MKLLKSLMIATDLGFLAYWIVTALALIPEAWLFKDYHDPLLMAWNWSFLPLDLLVSLTGLSAMVLTRSRMPVHAVRGQQLLIISLALTLCSGLMAIAFWTVRLDFDPWWWSFNGFLLLYPAVALCWLIFGSKSRPEAV